MKNRLTADELITGTGIASKIILEESDLTETAIDAALSDAYVEGISADTWERRTRELLGLNPC